MANYQASGSGSGSNSGDKGYRPIEILLPQLKQYAVRFSQSMETLKAINEAEIAQVQMLEDDKENFMKLLGELVRNLAESQHRERGIAQVRQTEEIFATTDTIGPFLKQVMEYKGQTRARMARIDQEIIWVRNILSRLEKLALQVIEMRKNKNP